MSRQIVSPTVEEYLEQIYRLEKEWGVARTGHIAEIVGVSLGTVTNTIDSLKQQKLVTHEPYKGVKLTDAGLRIAIDVIRRHRLAERLLTDFLKLDWSSVHEHACKLEHAITDVLMKPLEKALGHPTSCPHGNPIPKACGGILEEASQPLVDLPEGGKGVVAKIINENREVLEYLQAINLVPGTPIEVVEKAPLNGPITLLIAGSSRPISRKLATFVWIKQED